MFCAGQEELASISAIVAYNSKEILTTRRAPCLRHGRACLARALLSLPLICLPAAAPRTCRCGRSRARARLAPFIFRAVPYTAFLFANRAERARGTTPAAVRTGDDVALALRALDTGSRCGTWAKEDLGEDKLALEAFGDASPARCTTNRRWRSPLLRRPCRPRSRRRGYHAVGGRGTKGRCAVDGRVGRQCDRGARFDAERGAEALRVCRIFPIKFLRALRACGGGGEGAQGHEGEAFGWRGPANVGATAMGRDAWDRGLEESAAFGEGFAPEKLLEVVWLA